MLLLEEYLDRKTPRPEGTNVRDRKIKSRRPKLCGNVRNAIFELVYAPEVHKRALTSRRRPKTRRLSAVEEGASTLRPKTRGSVLESKFRAF